ncbi:mucin-16-like [Diceros bicornis minor]|uniref:mucin-16-like n=1 Tax=Diceros bicornis minor TaxID=77932 RepID=UPI0026ED357D|nr:mucin-16-like [Diceros bicornis minor]
MIVILKFSTNINVWRCYIFCVQGLWLSYSFPVLPQHQGHSRLPTSPPTFSVPCLSEAFQGPLPGVPTSPSLCPSLPRPEKGGTATGVDAVCLHLPDPMGPKLDSERERLFWELSHETLGVTQMGSFILDRHSLCINGYTHWTSASSPSATVTSMLFPWTSVV